MRRPPSGPLPPSVVLQRRQPPPLGPPAAAAADQPPGAAVQLALPNKGLALPILGRRPALRGPQQLSQGPGDARSQAGGLPAGLYGGSQVAGGGQREAVVAARGPLIGRPQAQRMAGAPGQCGLLQEGDGEDEIQDADDDSEAGGDLEVVASVGVPPLHHADRGPGEGGDAQGDVGGEEVGAGETHEQLAAPAAMPAPRAVPVLGRARSRVPPGGMASQRQQQQEELQQEEEGNDALVLDDDAIEGELAAAGVADGQPRSQQQQQQQAGQPAVPQLRPPIIARRTAAAGRGGAAGAGMGAEAAAEDEDELENGAREDGGSEGPGEDAAASVSEDEHGKDGGAVAAVAAFVPVRPLIGRRTGHAAAAPVAAEQQGQRGARGGGSGGGGFRPVAARAAAVAAPPLRPAAMGLAAVRAFTPSRVLQETNWNAKIRHV